MNNASGGSPSQRLARALAAAAVPVPFRQAFSSGPPFPAPGQLWRARRSDIALLVLLTRVDTTAVEAVPVTLDHEFETEDSYVLNPDAALLGVQLTVWPQLARTVPMRVLDNYAGVLTLDRATTDPTGAVRSSGRPGRPAVSPADPALEYRARIVEAAAVLAAAPEPYGSGDLPAILSAAGLAPKELAQILGVGLPMVLQLRRGEAALSLTQAEQLAPVLGLDVDALVAANPAPPTVLLAQAAQPRRRGQVVALARAKGLSEDDAYARVVYDAYALAARAAGDTDTAEAWNARLDRYFEMVFDA